MKKRTRKRIFVNLIEAWLIAVGEIRCVSLIVLCAFLWKVFLRYVIRLLCLMSKMSAGKSISDQARDRKPARSCNRRRNWDGFRSPISTNCCFFVSFVYGWAGEDIVMSLTSVAYFGSSTPSRCPHLVDSVLAFDASKFRFTTASHIIALGLLEWKLVCVLLRGVFLAHSGLRYLSKQSW